MKTWTNTKVITCLGEDLKKTIRARAWSVGSAMSMGEFLDSGNAGAIGTVYMEANPGHMIQVEIIGTFILLGILTKEVMFSNGETRRYQKIAGIWIQV